MMDDVRTTLGAQASLPAGSHQPAEMKLVSCAAKQAGMPALPTVVLTSSFVLN